MKDFDDKQTLEQIVPRVLMQWNRNPMSPAYGSFDRNFWNFKTMTDFSCATFQQAVLGLSELYADTESRTPYAGQPLILEAIRSGVLFWCKIQQKDGSQDEYYQNERSFCATAFTTFAVARAFSKVPEAWSSEERNRIHSKIVRAAKWLSRYSNPDVQNQMIVSMNALYWVARLTKSVADQEVFKKRRAEVLATQSSEGWFPEYGGADIGYSFKQLDFLCSYLALEPNDAEVRAAAEKLITFIVHFLHPDGTAGGSYGSRCTEHVFPFGMEWMARNGSKDAVSAVNWYRFHRARQSAIGPEIVDDKYLIYFYFFSFVQSALLPASALTISDSPHVIGKSGLITWPLAGLSRWIDGDHAIWISRKRNGVLRWFYKGKNESGNSGYEIELKDGRFAATQSENDSSKIHFAESAGRLEIKINGHVGAVDLSLPLVRWMVPFKWVCRTLLRIDFLAVFYSRWLKKTKIADSKTLPIQFERHIQLSGKTLAFQDRILSQAVGLKKVLPLENTTIVHSPSSRYFHNQYLTKRKQLTPVLEGPREFRFQWEVTSES